MRQLLQANVTEFMEHFLQGRDPAYAGLHHPLSSHQGLPLLPLPWAPFAGKSQFLCVILNMLLGQMEGRAGTSI